jgi:SAM-dependent methyltransferase
VNHGDHVYLLRDGVPAPGGVWADLGSGWGAFTLALADLIGPAGQIYSVDKDPNALREQEQALRARFPEVPVHTITADFTRHLDLPPLDGVVLANALHFVADRHGQREEVVQIVKSYLRPGGRLVLVEYDADEGNQWVPYPLSYTTWEKVARRCGFATTRQLATVPSRFLKEIYSAVSFCFWEDEIGFHEK